MITYTDTQAAKTTFVVVTSGRHKRRQVAKFTHNDRTGKNKVHFAGRGLARGSYRLLASPRRAGRTGKSVAISFRVM